MAVATLDNVAMLYVATFNRAPLQTGLTYWVNSGLSIEGIAQSFFDQPETQVLYPAGTSNTAFVTSIYTNLFGRAPLQAGIDYWTGASGLGGTMTRGQMILAMANGALGADATLIDNKTDVGQYYAAAGLTATNYSLSSVTADPATVTAAMNAIGDTVTPTYTMAAGATSVTEGTAVSFTVTSNVSQSATRTMNYQIEGVAVAGGTATPASDLGAVTGTVTILAGATTGTFTLTPTNDGVIEGFEGFKVSLLNSSFATVATSGNVVIMDGASAGLPFTLTTGADTGAAFTGGSGNDTFNAADTTATTWTVGDAINGGDGTDTFNITRAAAITQPVAATVSNIETVNAISGATVTLNTTTGWSGLTTLNTTGVGGATVTSAATTDVTVTDSAMVTITDGGITINGGKNVTATLTAADATTDGDAAAEIVVGSTSAAAGAVAVTLTGKYNDAINSMSNIAVTGGTNVTVTTATGITAAQITAQQNDGSNGTITQSAISVIGNASTTAATVTQGAAVILVDTAAIGKIGIKNGEVTIADANSTSTTAAGTLATVTLNNYGNSTINSGALTAVNLSGTGGTLGITTGSLTTPAVTTMALNVNGLSYKNAGSNNAISVDADITTLNIGSTTAASTVNNITATGATTVNVSGDALLTMTNSTFAAATAISSSTQTAGGVSLGTALGTGVLFTGGAGADTISIGSTTKAITMGAGNDTVTTSTGVVGTGGSVAAGDGTADKIIFSTTAHAVTAGGSSTFNSKFTGFEVVELTAALSGTMNVSGINNAGTVILKNGGDNLATAIVQDLVSGGTVQTEAAGTGITVNILSAVGGTTDVLNYKMVNTVATTFTKLTAANVETVNITVADAAATGASNAVIHLATLAATSATSVTVVGNNGLNLTNTGNTAITNFDASGVVANSTAATTSVVATTDSAANLAVTFASANVTATANVTIKGGAGDDTLTGSVAKDTISGNAGADAIYSDNAGTKAAHEMTLTDVAGTVADTITFDGGVSVAFTGSTTATLTGAAIIAAVAADATASKLVTVTAGAAGVILVTYKTDGVHIAPTLGETAATTVNVIDGTGTSIIGTAGTTAIDTIDGGAGADVLVGGGGADTITTGTGADNVFMMKAHSVLATMATITDFTYAVGGTSNDKLIIGDVTTVIGTTATVQDLSAQATLALAMDAAALTNTTNFGLSVFTWGTNEYAFVETTGATTTYQATDFVVKLTGVPLAVGATIAGAGFDAV